MSKANAKKNTKIWIIAAAAAVLVLIAVLFLIPEEEPVQATEPAQTEPVQTEAPQETQPAPVLRDALRVEEIGSYTGIYVEDGSDEAVSGLLMMVVTNISDEPIQYAQIEMEQNGKKATFAVSVLPAGGTAVLIEQNRMAYDENADHSAPECVNLAGFDAPLSLQEDKLEIQVLDGAINITNISGEDITDTIVLCYKNVSNGVYHGGIAYRVRVEGGLKADEIRQAMGTHFHQDGSEILFVDFAA